MSTDFYKLPTTAAKEKYEEYLTKFEYFVKLKSKQEKSIETKYRKYKDVHKDASVTDKKEKLGNIKNSLKCLKCKKRGGTIFSSNVNSGDHILQAVCGHKEDPCSLNIKLKKPTVIDIPVHLERLRKNINLQKRVITEYKLDLLFDLDDEQVILTEFQNKKVNLQKLLAAATQLKEYTVTQNYSVNISDSSTPDSSTPDSSTPDSTHYISKKKYLRDKVKEFNQLVSDFKKNIKEYQKTEETDLLKDILTGYKNVIVPLQTDIMNTTYQTIYMERLSQSSNNKINVLDMPVYHFIPTRIDIQNEIIEMGDSEVLEYSK